MMKLTSAIKLYDNSSPWRISALLSAAMETSTLPSRLRNGRTNLGDMSMMLNLLKNRNISSTDFSMLDPDGSMLGEPTNLSWTSKNKHVFATIDVLRSNKEPVVDEQTNGNSRDKVHER